MRAQAKHHVHARADHRGKRRGQTRALDAQHGRTKLAEDKDIVQEDVAGVHHDQRAHVQPREIHGVPVTPKRKIYTDKHDGQQAHLQVGHALSNDLRVAVEPGEKYGRSLIEQAEISGCDEQHENERAIQDDRRFIVATLALAPGRRGLNAGRDPEDQRHAHEHGKAAQPDGRQRSVAQRADHGRIDQVQDVLRNHAANDRQREAHEFAETAKLQPWAMSRRAARGMAGAAGCRCSA